MADTSLPSPDLLTPDEQMKLETIKRNRAAGFLPTLLELDFLLEIYDRLTGVRDASQS